MRGTRTRRGSFSTALPGSDGPLGHKRVVVGSSQGAARFAGVDHPNRLDQDGMDLTGRMDSLPPDAAED